jgi:hypothetical protein
MNSQIDFVSKLMAASAALALALAAPAAASAQDDSCAALADTPRENVTIASATLQPEGEPVLGATITDASGTPTPVAGLPAFCRVVGTLQPEAGSNIGFEVWLPSKDWEGRFIGANNGGFAGYISYVDLAAAVAAGYAGASTDTGHVDATGMDATWAVGHPERVRDFGWRGVHVTTVLAKELIREYYGRAQNHSYFIGCSNGGRQGLMEAWRFPEDYDGIISGAPAASFTALAATFSSTVQAQLPEGAALSPAQLPLLQSEVLKQCDALDGQRDGIVSSPWACRVDTTPLACGTTNAAECLTEPQLAAYAKITAGRRDRYGRSLAAGIWPSGLEATPMVGWDGWILANPAAPPAHEVFARGVLQGLVPTPIATPQTFDFERDQPALSAALATDIDVPPQLGPFFERGGKLILWHGWADPAVPAQHTLALHRTLARNAGARSDDALRLFMAPGVLHCERGSGADLFGQSSAPPPGAAPERNLAAALEAWVESGRAPNQVIGSYSSDAAKQGLLCAFPQRAKLRSGADPAQVDSYTCQR